MQAQEPHRIIEMDEKQSKAAERLNKALMGKNQRPQTFPLSLDESRLAKSLTTKQRSGWMRNKPCPCGSGEKFKKCHW